MRLQAVAGNRAVARLIAGQSRANHLVIQRCGGERHEGCPCADEDAATAQRAETAGVEPDPSPAEQQSGDNQEGPSATAPSADGHRTFTSPRFVGDAKLEACLNDKARLGPGDVSQSTARVQQALIDLGHDLGPAGADMVYGTKTASAVRAFKSEQNLGFTQYGDVGPGTMGRLDELFPGELPPCPILGPDTDSSTNALAEAAPPTDAVRAGAPVGLAFAIPGLLCQIGPTQPLPTNTAGLPENVRATLQVSTSRHDQTNLNAAYQIFRGGLRATGSLGSVRPIFGDGVPTGGGQAEDIRDGLVSVGSFVLGSRPTGLPVGNTLSVSLGDVPGRNGPDGKPTVQPGGYFRLTHVQLRQGDHLLFERLGDFASRAPGPRAATSRAEFDAAFATEQFRLVGNFAGAQIRLLEQALRRLTPATLARINGTTFDLSPRPTINNEEGSYDPNTHRITLVQTALDPTATSPGGFSAGQFTLQHEVGHALSDRDGQLAALFAAAARGSTPLTTYGRTSAEENLAECVALFSVDPAQLQALRPRIFAMLNDRYR